jgi:hypothetical protein
LKDTEETCIDKQKLEIMKESYQSEDWEKIAGDPIMMPLMYALL